jgi:hypothetical protein
MSLFRPYPMLAVRKCTRICAVDEGITWLVCCRSEDRTERCSSFSTHFLLHVKDSGISLVRVPGYRSRGPGSIPGSTRFSEKWWIWNGAHAAS